VQNFREIGFTVPVMDGQKWWSVSSWNFWETSKLLWIEKWRDRSGLNVWEYSGTPLKRTTGDQRKMSFLTGFLILNAKNGITLSAKNFGLKKFWTKILSQIFSVQYLFRPNFFPPKKVLFFTFYSVYMHLNKVSALRGSTLIFYYKSGSVSFIIF